ncbi:hypothetical protein N7474_002247 [Penicillium riverlandense]|uniref:uncharacterized protein n=1 Tax=Penicillium riverlandense TaxID=1903569 RepID=UPI002548FCCF|nr:uncharacterized protein N7474_002247 [Penicillium riverlandense]KAJ5833936.1 hypothetical protein N7474_002247 [Penicillium riverlandense]
MGRGQCKTLELSVKTVRPLQIDLCLNDIICSSRVFEKDTLQGDVIAAAVEAVAPIALVGDNVIEPDGLLYYVALGRRKNY